MIVRKTALEEARRVNELFAICFEMPYTNCPADPEKDDATHWAAFDEDGEMMSTFTVSDFTVQFDGSPCKWEASGASRPCPSTAAGAVSGRASGKRCRICTVPGMIFLSLPLLHRLLPEIRLRKLRAEIRLDGGPVPAEPAEGGRQLPPCGKRLPHDRRDPRAGRHLGVPL